MDEKPKAITKLVWLWLFLSGIFFLLSIDSFIFIIINISKYDPGGDLELGLSCLAGFLFIFLFSIIFGLYALKIGSSIKKGNKSKVESGFFFSTLSLLIFIGPFVFLVWTVFSSSFNGDAIHRDATVPG
jgi:hypothetical protein